MFNQCKKYGVPMWQCPSFLFFVMGLVIIGTIIIAYFLGSYYFIDPSIVFLIITLLTITLLIISFTIVSAFEQIADSNRLKSEFINIISHQLRSPITNFSWVLDFLLSDNTGKFKKEQLEYLEILKTNNVRMKDLVKDLIVVSKIDEGSFQILKEKISLVDIIKDIIAKYQPSAQSQNIQIDFQFDKDFPEIISDSARLRASVERFLDNAIRYIKAKKGKISISLRKKDGAVLFEIKDNGVGIPKEEQKYIFQKFFRARKITEYQTQGSGLSLFIVKTIIEKLGGRIWFQSEEGKGTTFWFTLPIN